ncbi:MAG: hypothetical protein ACE5PV_07340 [Candidatus Poribacteria bacterium]
MGTWFVTISFGILIVSAISYSIASIWRKQGWQERNMVKAIETLEKQARAFRLKLPKSEFNCMVDDMADAAWVAMRERANSDEAYFAMKASIRDVLRKYVVDYR